MSLKYLPVFFLASAAWSSLYACIAQARYNTMATFTTSNTCICRPAILSVLHAPLIRSAMMTPGILICAARRTSSTNDTANPIFDSTLNSPIFFMLYSPNMRPRPMPTITRCSLTKSILSLLPSLRREVEENMARMEIMISRNTIIHTTLSPSILSMKPHKPLRALFFSPFPIS